MGYVIGSSDNENRREGVGDNFALKIIPHRVISNEMCRQRKFSFLTSMELCAVAQGSMGPCEGDSGSPLLNSEMNLQFGILSYSRSTCKPNRIYVFTRIEPFLEWINRTMTKLLS
ncbi:tryptase-2-like [Musca domestica]|uniref:Tryptase-2-like n=1 Tax=Musca domestica TaxID=7370 RepID=A0A9J7DGE4_MUSDO|nr:tryptase-2-like [Musca domestica]